VNHTEDPPYSGPPGDNRLTGQLLCRPAGGDAVGEAGRESLGSPGSDQRGHPVFVVRRRTAPAEYAHGGPPTDRNRGRNRQPVCSIQPLVRADGVTCRTRTARSHPSYARASARAGGQLQRGGQGEWVCRSSRSAGSSRWPPAPAPVTPGAERSSPATRRRVGRVHSEVVITRCGRARAGRALAMPRAVASRPSQEVHPFTNARRVCCTITIPRRNWRRSPAPHRTRHRVIGASYGPTTGV